MVSAVLARHGKALAPQRCERLIDAEWADLPEWLCVALGERRVVDKHEELDRQIATLALALHQAQLLRQVLDRLESEFDVERPHLVHDALALLGDEAPLPRAIWAPLTLSLAALVTERCGLLVLRNEAARDAVGERLSAVRGGSPDAHLTLAEHFARDHTAPRALAELPWQPAAAATQPTLKVTHKP